MIETADVAIVGAGMMGVTTTFRRCGYLSLAATDQQLAQSGITSVLR